MSIRFGMFMVLHPESTSSVDGLSMAASMKGRVSYCRGKFEI